MEGQNPSSLEIIVLDNNSVPIEELLMIVKFLMAVLVVDLANLIIIDWDEEFGDFDVANIRIYLDDSGVFHQKSVFSLY